MQAHRGWGETCGGEVSLALPRVVRCRLGFAKTLWAVWLRSGLRCAGGSALLQLGQHGSLQPPPHRGFPVACAAE